MDVIYELSHKLVKEFEILIFIDTHVSSFLQDRPRFIESERSLNSQPH